MTYRELLGNASERLSKSEVLFCDTPLLDASVLLTHAAEITKEKLFASYPDFVPVEVQNKFEKMLKKRLSGQPVSYIRNVKEFYGRDFYVDNSVLVPRPDTETIIEKTLSLTSDKNNRILDLCTGSGCIGITLKLEKPELEVTVSDISKEALNVAQKNAKTLEADINFVNGSLFDKIEGFFDIIVTNPPYVKSSETQHMLDSGWPEPKIALDGGEDGLDLIREIIRSSLNHLNDNGYLLIEAGQDQAEKISELLSKAGFHNIEITKDIEGRNRVTSGMK
ncbi:MAG: peptide chain release factor N(5)-glutamine methyltransferase [Spirochaetales bacterium]|nr:peptide chain release factor N(5)-glutamine methyltransferase [Spirochaetales bacterium]